MKVEYFVILIWASDQSKFPLLIFHADQVSPEKAERMITSPETYSSMPRKEKYWAQSIFTQDQYLWNEIPKWDQ